MARKHAPQSANTALADCQIIMSNAITRAAQSLTLTEKRVMSCAIARLDSIRGAWTSDKLKVKLTASEYAETFGLDVNTAYEELSSFADSIMKKQIRTVEKVGRRERVTKYQWVGKAVYAKGEGWIEIAFYHEIAPHLMMLSKNFTQYKLKQASALRSLYAWRLLELLQMFASTGLLRMPLDEFQHAMDPPKSYRANFAQLRRWVIEPAIKELEGKDNWIIKWTPKKHGRKVIGLEFRFHRNPQGRLDLEPKPKRKKPRRLTREEIAKQARPGETWEQAATRLRATDSSPDHHARGSAAGPGARP